MIRSRSIARAVLVTLLWSVGGFGLSRAAGPALAQATPSLTITAPANGATVSNPVSVIVPVTGVTNIKPASAGDPNSSAAASGSVVSYRLLQPPTAERPQQTACDAEIISIREQLQERQSEALAGTSDGSISDLMPQFLQLLTDCFAQRIQPDLLTATTDCGYAQLTHAVGDAELWTKTVRDEFGFYDQVAEQIALVNQELVAVHVNCYNEAFDRCVKDRDYTQYAVMQTEHRLALQFLAADAPDPVDLTKLDRCLTFELDFDSTIVDTTITITQHISARVRLNVDPSSNNKLTGRANLQEQTTVTKRSSDPCSYTVPAPAPAEGYLEVLAGSIDLQGGHGNDPGVDLAVQLAVPVAMPIMTCQTPGGPPISVRVPPPWGLVFPRTHSDEVVVPGTYAFSNWDPGSGDVLARKQYDRTYGGIYHETTTLELKFVPQQ